MAKPKKKPKLENPNPEPTKAPRVAKSAAKSPATPPPLPEKLGPSADFSLRKKNGAWVLSEHVIGLRGNETTKVHPPDTLTMAIARLNRSLHRIS